MKTIAIFLLSITVLLGGCGNYNQIVCYDKLGKQIGVGQRVYISPNSSGNGGYDYVMCEVR